eukprot:CAMPEP_0174333736 /NCGR_PEP_ID=MMETSP0810-20121108/19386_1 /TAXON_ID=73025 ORGANISM="Eutreptiella gymnastica-like, Strain CCMP1594" /NCGR_SAMPLE_ID=MMETSP0810 /ASSEMBLY_ACC=CAM_ASM_000659 /LENGTH=76 /DNA_ID=CAMNT_0015451023 /DNA_START=287 /DNA_END=517 /DNA_ORIENTATION=-
MHSPSQTGLGKAQAPPQLHSVALEVRIVGFLTGTARFLNRRRAQVDLEVGLQVEVFTLCRTLLSLRSHSLALTRYI